MRALALLLVFSAWVLCGFSAPRVADSAVTPTFTVGTADLSRIGPSQPPPASAKAEALIDFTTGKVLFSRNADEHLAQASTTKIMTALLTLERGRLDDRVTVSAAAAAEPGTSMGLVAGETLSERELLYGLLLPSGNDAAIALAEHIGGSVEAFVRLMNDRAVALGLADTHFMNPPGLDDRGHYSSAMDLARLARYALMTEPLLDQIVATKAEDLPPSAGHPAFDLTNLNQLLGSYDGADGVKTGTTPAAGQALVGSATRDGHRLLAVILGSQDRYKDARALLDFGFSRYTWWGPDRVVTSLLAVPSSPTTVLLPSWEVGQVRLFADPDTGVATFSLSGQVLMTAALGDEG